MGPVGRNETDTNVPCEANRPKNAHRGGFCGTPAGVAEGLRPEEGTSGGDLGDSWRAVAGSLGYVVRHMAQASRTADIVGRGEEVLPLCSPLILSMYALYMTYRKTGRFLGGKCITPTNEA